MTNWKLHTKTELKSLDWNESPTVTVLGKAIPITYLINPTIRIFRAKIEKAIDDKVKGRTPSGNPQQQAGEVNPWKKETFNLTKQGEIIMSNPSVAEQMKRAAGK